MISIVSYGFFYKTKPFYPALLRKLKELILADLARIFPIAVEFVARKCVAVCSMVECSICTFRNCSGQAVVL